MYKKDISKLNIAVIGLGYVGLPLALEFSKYFNTIGYDINKNRINELSKNFDKNNEVKFKRNNKFKLTWQISKLQNCNIFIITVPTPILINKKPDLSMIKKSTISISKFIKKGDIIIYESTVYPGVTENVCGNLISKRTKLILNKDFYLGYSPERINPGDNKNTLKNIKKIVSGSNKYSLEIIYKIYHKIIKAGIYKAPSIKIAEAAKVIENAQRDINIAYINELKLIFEKSGLDFNSIIEAAKTKWNFLNFFPGLVGGHCIGVDPHYLNFYAEKYNYKTKIILPARKLNEKMIEYHYKFFNKKYNNYLRKNNLNSKKILFLGLSFKKNTNDYRNSKYIDIYKLLKKLYKIDAYDPLMNPKDKLIKTLIKPKIHINLKEYSAIIIGANHDIFKKILKNKLNKNLFIYNLNK